MKNQHYPDDLSKLDKANHLLFDFGFSCALIRRTQELLQRLLPVIEVANLYKEIEDLLGTIKELQEGQLQLRSDIYDNVDAALEIDRKTAALQEAKAATGKEI